VLENNVTFPFNNEPDAVIIQIYSVIKLYMFYDRINLDNYCVWLVIKKKSVTTHDNMNVNLALLVAKVGNTEMYTVGRMWGFGGFECES
jgi:hypothetical protein